MLMGPTSKCPSGVCIKTALFMMVETTLREDVRRPTSCWRTTEQMNSGCDKTWWKRFIIRAFFGCLPLLFYWSAASFGWWEDWQWDPGGKGLFNPSLHCHFSVGNSPSWIVRASICFVGGCRQEKPQLLFSPPPPPTHTRALQKTATGNGGINPGKITLRTGWRTLPESHFNSLGCDEMILCSQPFSCCTVP